MSNEFIDEKLSELANTGYESSESSDSASIKNEMDIDIEPPNKTSKNVRKSKIDPDLANLQKVDIFLQQLPYFDKIKLNAFQAYEEIKLNLAECIALNEIRPGFVHWTNRLIIFIHEYGLFFTKEEHIRLIKLYIELMLTPEIDLPTVDLCFQILTDLLKKYDKISREELTIEWRPIYNLYMRIHKINDISSVLAPENLEQTSFANFIRYVRIYFDSNSTEEMLAEWRPILCPFDLSMSKAFERYKLFLPTILYEHENGHKLWLNEFLDIWTTLSTRHYWETHLTHLFSRVAHDTIGEFDWSPYIPYIFSNILRGFGLPFGSKDSTLGIANSTTPAVFKNSISRIMTYSTDEISTICTWVVSMIGSGTGANRTLCMDHIKRLFQALRSFYYPSNSGSWSANLFGFLQNLPDRLIKRIKREKRDKSKWFLRPSRFENCITEEEIIEFVNALKEASFTAIFSKSNHSAAIKAFQYLTFLRGEIMLPPLIEKLNESIESLIEPHRYTSILGCLVSVARELASYNPNHKIQTQIHIIPLMSAVLPGLDPNDSNKSILTLQFLHNILSCVIVMDCSPALNIRNDLTEHERELIFQTSKFEDFIHEFFVKIFNFIDNLSSDAVNESSATAAHASTQYTIGNNKNMDDVSQVYLLQALKALMRQSSKDILKLILNKVKNYINGNTYNIRSGRILSGLCYYLSSSGIGESAFNNFFDYVYENLRKFKESKNYENFLLNERGDIEVTWNLQLLSELLKSDGRILIVHINRINQIFSWLRKTIHKEAFNYVGFCFRNLLTSLTTINPNNLCSVNYNIIFDDSNEFFTKHLPIRDWACTGDLFKLNIDYHIPSVQELSVAIDITDKELNNSIEFLNKSILLNSENQITKSTKEERTRELTYINFIIYGASKLLKRPSNKSYITNHIDSCVNIGLKDNLNKGLGYELANCYDETHEYSNLTVENSDILLKKREFLIDFILKLAEKLIEVQTSETTLLILCSRILSLSSITYGLFVNDFEKMWKAHCQSRSSMQNKLLGKKNSLRDELVQRVMLQYKFRSFHVHTVLNEVDLRIIELLFKLSVDSIYANVRKDAQTQLFSILSHYPYSSLLIIPKIVNLLKKAEQNELTHDQLKGCLYLIRGNGMQETMTIKQNWEVIYSMWPTLFKFQQFEKPSIQTLLDKIYLKTNKDYDSFDNRIKLNAKIINIAYEMNPVLEVIYSKNDEKRLTRFTKKLQNDNKIISSLMNDMTKIASEPQLLWKNQPTIFGSVLFLLNACELEKSLLTVECVQLYVDSLVNENINVRRISIDALCIILKMVKFKKETKIHDIIEVIKGETNNIINNENQIEINRSKPGYRNDNSWHLYDPKFLNNLYEKSEQDNKKWENTKFLDKSYWGYYCWPSKIEINSNKRKTFTRDTNEFSDSIKPIENKFKNDAEFVKKFIKLATIEEAKGQERFDKKKFHLFKALFRNYGSVNIINNLYEHLTMLVSDRQIQTHECSHKLAAEIISGLIRGSKYWPLDDLKVMWAKLKNILDLVIDNISTENIKLWLMCFSTAFEDQDPRRMIFYLNYLTELTRRIFGLNDSQKKENETLSSASSFQQSSCLQLLSSLSQMEWRIPLFWSNILDIFLLNMTHPYKAIREKNSMCLSLCSINHIDYSVSMIESDKINTTKNKSENLIKLVNLVETKLNEYIELFDKVEDNEPIDENMIVAKPSDKEHLEAINFVQSAFDWFPFYVMKSFQPINCDLLRIIPQICSVDKIAAQEVTVKLQLPIIRMFVSMWIMDKKCSIYFVEQLKKVIASKNWHSRLAAIQMLQNFSIFNLFVVSDEIKKETKKILLNSLCDEQLEVRLSASITLTGFIHSNFMQVDQELLNYYKSLCKIAARKKDKDTGKMVINTANLIKRHGGILGLCSIVSSCPYDVPAYLPEAVTYLCQFINDPVPIQGSVRKCLSEFRRTHHDNWQEHKQSFDESQLSVLADILISPNYYA